MARKSSPTAYSHTALLKDVERDENNKVINISAPYGSADIAKDGSVIATRLWDNAKAKAKTSPKKAKAA